MLLSDKDRFSAILVPKIFLICLTHYSRLFLCHLLLFPCVNTKYLTIFAFTDCFFSVYHNIRKPCAFTPFYCLFFFNSIITLFTYYRASRTSWFCRISILSFFFSSVGCIYYNFLAPFKTRRPLLHQRNVCCIWLIHCRYPIIYRRSLSAIYMGEYL